MFTSRDMLSPEGDIFLKIFRKIKKKALFIAKNQQNVRQKSSVNSFTQITKKNPLIESVSEKIYKHVKQN